MITKSVTSKSLSIGYIIPVRKDYTTFIVLGQEVNIISDELSLGRNTVGEINNKFYYLGTDFPNVAAAIFTWQNINGRELTSEELRQVLVDNKLVGVSDGC